MVDLAFWPFLLLDVNSETLCFYKLLCFICFLSWLFILFSSVFSSNLIFLHISKTCLQSSSKYLFDPLFLVSLSIFFVTSFIIPSICSNSSFIFSFCDCLPSSLIVSLIWLGWLFVVGLVSYKLYVSDYHPAVVLPADLGMLTSRPFLFSWQIEFCYVYSLLLKGINKKVYNDSAQWASYGYTVNLFIAFLVPLKIGGRQTVSKQFRDVSGKIWAYYHHGRQRNDVKAYQNVI